MKEKPKIKSLSGSLLTNNNRVRVKVELSDTSQKPTLDLFLEDSKGDEIAHSFIIGVIDPLTEFTMHILHTDLPLPYTVRCAVYLEADKILDTAKTIVRSAG